MYRIEFYSFFLDVYTVYLEKKRVNVWLIQLSVQGLKKLWSVSCSNILIMNSRLLFLFDTALSRLTNRIVSHTEKAAGRIQTNNLISFKRRQCFMGNVRKVIDKTSPKYWNIASTHHDRGEWTRLRRAQNKSNIQTLHYGFSKTH